MTLIYRNFKFIYLHRRWVITATNLKYAQTANNDKFLLHNPQTNQKVLQHLLPSTQKQTQINNNSIYLRRLQNQGRNNLVEVFQINRPEKKHQCCSYSPKMCSVITENIIGLSQISRLDISQICNLIFDWINGISILYKEFGYFQINTEMLGWNNRTIGKSWINSNYSLNIPQTKRDCKSNFQFQRYAINKIVELILKNYNGRQTYNINQLKQLSNYNFAAAKQKIRKILINIKNYQYSTFKQRNSFCQNQPLKQQIQNKQPIVNKEFKPLQTFKSPNKQINNQPFYTKTNLNTSTINNKYISQQNIKNIKPALPSNINFINDKTKTKSPTRTKIDLLSQLQTHIPQSYKITNSPSIDSTQKSMLNEDYYGLDTLNKTKPLLRQYSQIQQYCKMCPSIIESVLTVQKDMQLEQNTYKIQQSIIIRGMNQE